MSPIVRNRAFYDTSYLPLDMGALLNHVLRSEGSFTGIELSSKKSEKKQLVPRLMLAVHHQSDEPLSGWLHICSDSYAIE